jgi:hypothetical protein
MREVIDIIGSHPETPYTVNRLNELIDGVGYQTIKTACEKLVDSLKIKRSTGTYRGQGTICYEAMF